MSPKPADPEIRVALVETAARLIATEGLAGLTLRRLTREVGTSTMAVYTHFGSMDELRRAIRREGFARLSEHLNGVPVSDDPVVDLAMLGRAYWANAIENPNLYRAMFMDRPTDLDDAGVGLDTFDVLVDTVQRGIDAARFDRGEALPRAVQVWGLIHGLVTLHLAQLLTAEDALASLHDGATNLFLAFGDTRDGLSRSIGSSVARR